MIDLLRIQTHLSNQFDGTRVIRRATRSSVYISIDGRFAPALARVVFDRLVLVAMGVL